MLPSTGGSSFAGLAAADVAGGEAGASSGVRGDSGIGRATALGCALRAGLRALLKELLPPPGTKLWGLCFKDPLRVMLMRATPVHGRSSGVEGRKVSMMLSCDLGKDDLKEIIAPFKRIVRTN